MITDAIMMRMEAFKGMEMIVTDADIFSYWH
jgi:hypothetical protein